MVLRDDDRQLERPQPGRRPEQWPQRRSTPDEDDNALSLADTLRELGVTILGFVGVIVLIIAVVGYFRG